MKNIILVLGSVISMMALCSCNSSQVTAEDTPQCLTSKEETCVEYVGELQYVYAGDSVGKGCRYEGQLQINLKIDGVVQKFTVSAPVKYEKMESQEFRAAINKDFLKYNRRKVSLKFSDDFSLTSCGTKLLQISSHK